jgi:hypothetical protein
LWHVAADRDVGASDRPGHSGSAVSQWVLSFPWPLRLLFASRPDALGRCLAVKVRAIQTDLARRAALTAGSGARTGVVTLVQRFGNAPNPIIHLHILILDGAYTLEQNGFSLNCAVSCQAHQRNLSGDETAERMASQRDAPDAEGIQDRDDIRAQLGIARARASGSVAGNRHRAAAPPFPRRLRVTWAGRRVPYAARVLLDHAHDFHRASKRPFPNCGPAGVASEPREIRDGVALHALAGGRRFRDRRRTRARLARGARPVGPAGPVVRRVHRWTHAARIFHPYASHPAILPLRGRFRRLCAHGPPAQHAREPAAHALRRSRLSGAHEALLRHAGGALGASPPMAAPARSLRARVHSGHRVSSRGAMARRGTARDGHARAAPHGPAPRRAAGGVSRHPSRATRPPDRYGPECAASGARGVDRAVAVDPGRMGSESRSLCVGHRHVRIGRPDPRADWRHRRRAGQCGAGARTGFARHLRVGGRRRHGPARRPVRAGAPRRGEPPPAGARRVDARGPGRVPRSSTDRPGVARKSHRPAVP